jgi:hypothetical protein
MRWIALGLCVLVVWVVMFVIAPMGQRLASIRPLADYIDETGINASALYYTGVPETAEAEMYLRHASKYPPTGGVLRD